MPLNPQEKLQWLGLKDSSQRSSVIETEVAMLREEYDSYEDFSSMVESEFNFNSMESELEFDAGFTEDEATTFTQKIQDNFDDDNRDGTVFDEFQTHTINSDGWAKFKSVFSQNTSFTSQVQTDNGGAAAGLEVHDTRGTTRDGVSVPPGTIEVFGVQVHFSDTGNTRTGEGTGTPGGGGGGQGPEIITISEFETDSGQTTFNQGERVTLTATVENNADYSEDAAITLYEDGETNRTIVLGSLGADSSSTQSKLGPGESREVSFEVVKSEYGCSEYRVNTSDAITVCWTPEGVDQGGSP